MAGGGIPQGSPSRSPLAVAVVSVTPIFASGVRQMLENGPDAPRCEIFIGHQLAVPSDFSPDVVLLTSQNWEEMALLLPLLQKQFAALPWLVLAEWRLAGTFLSFLEMQRCAVVPPSSSPAELRTILRLLVKQSPPCLATSLLMLFVRGFPSLPKGYRNSLPTPRELQCGCALSLGLTNRQISYLLHVGEGTVKSHVHHLLQKLGLSDREAVAGLFRRTFPPHSPPFG